MSILSHGIRRILFVSQQQAESMRVPTLACLVSITDTKRAQASLQEGWLAVLRLSFDDVDEITFPGANPDLCPLSHAQAETIASFVMANASRAKTIVVHCRHGISRSSAVAKAIADAMNVAFPASYAEFNRQVHEMVSDAMKRSFLVQHPLD